MKTTDLEKIINKKFKEACVLELTKNGEIINIGFAMNMFYHGLILGLDLPKLNRDK
jgi:hypothetical protein